MLSIILKSAWRRLWKYKGYSAINITGLAVGLAVAILSGLWINEQWSYNRFHERSELIYQAMNNYTPTGEEMGTSPALPRPMAAALREETPGVKQVAVTGWGSTRTVIVGEKKLRREGRHVDPEFLQIFTFPLLEGSHETALTAPNNIVLTETLAQELFGNTSPLGQSVSIDNDFQLQVTGVIADIPHQSTIQFDYLIPFELMLQQQQWAKDSENNWGNFSFQIYFELEPQAQIEKIKQQWANVFVEHDPHSISTFNAHALSSWHLYSEFVAGKPVTGRIRYVRLFGVIGLLVLLIACINFVNISTARAEKRSKEVGVRKAVGAGRSTLIIQFLGEAAFLLILALGVSLLMAQLLLPAFNTLVDETIRIPWFSPTFWSILMGVLVLSTLLAGSYPAFFLTRFEAKEALQKTFQIGRGRNMWSRRALVSAQFAVSIALIAGSLVVHQQVRFAQERDQGYNQERLLSVPNTPGLDPKHETVKTELLASGMIDQMSSTGSPVTSIWSNMNNISWPGKAEDTQIGFAFIAVDYNYFETLEMSFAQGRPFSPAYGTDTMAMVINEAAAARMGLSDPLQTHLEWNEQKYQIVGVVEDVIMENPFEPIRPAIFVLNPLWRSFYVMRLREGIPADQVLTTIGSIFEKHDPATPFNYEFVEEEYQRKFNSTNFIGTVALIFAGLAVFLSALGLLGLAIYLAERRAKEISIRKILGASVGQLWLLLSSEFMWLILFGGLLAMPLGGYFLQDWLDNFTYRIDLPWIVFGLAASIALVIALITISFQSIRAALVNPANRLRNE